MPGFPAATKVEARLRERCVACASDRLAYEFTVLGAQLLRCLDCTLLFLRDRAAASAAGDDEVASRARNRVDHLIAHLGTAPRSVLVVVPRETGVRIEGADVVDAATLLASGVPRASYDAVVCTDALDHVNDPDALLSCLWETLADGAVASFTVLSVDSSAARYAGASWRGFRRGGWIFYGIDTLQSALVRHGFRDPRTYFDGAVPAHSLRLRGVANVLGALRLRSAAVRAQSGANYLDESVTLIARRGERIRRHRVSVIVPVYNERRTFTQIMDRLIAKDVDDVDIDIIVVESNSSDGSREAVLGYAGHPRVDVILQDRPRGKGNAVRAALARVTGDIVLFQDADLEYEIEDYDDLIRPIVAYRRNFVIGSRHDVNKGGAWKMRQFTGAPVLARIFNAGHVLFLALLNGLYAQSLADPFSMFKVFRRDCLAGLRFECDRFDFDFEIVIKLLRKGYHPIEIPVNYHSRSIADGKKVTMIRDPVTWLAALARFRYSPLYPNDPAR